MKQLSFCLATITAFSLSAYALNCPPVLPPLGGTTSFTGEAREGSVAVGQCPLGQTMSGPYSITCTNGAWSPPAFGICTTGVGGLMQSSSDSLAGLSSGVGTGLGNGLTGLGNGLGTGVAGLGNGLGNGLGGGLGTGMGTAQCLPMLPPPGSTISYSTGASSTGLPPLQNHGTIATMRCNDNSPVSGTSVATCQNGQWQPPTMGTCTNNNSNGLGSPMNTGLGSSGSSNVVPGLSGSLPCPLGVVPPLNGNVVYSSTPPYSQGTTATLTCNAGFVVKGQSTVSCQNGLFGVLGTCEKVSV